MVRLINQEDHKVADAVGREAQHIARAVDIITGHMKQGGRLIYVGAGTSGRLGILDAVECPPTYSTEPGWCRASSQAAPRPSSVPSKGAEMIPDLGRKDLEEIHHTKQDVLVGIAASGRTPYVIGAMEYAKSLGGVTIGVTCCPGSEIDTLAEVGIAPDARPRGRDRLYPHEERHGPEDDLEYAVHRRDDPAGQGVRQPDGDVKPTNEKLVRRCVSIVCAAAR